MTSNENVIKGIYEREHGPFYCQIQTLLFE
jgi:hypothetical protein